MFVTGSECHLGVAGLLLKSKPMIEGKGIEQESVIEGWRIGVFQNGVVRLKKWKLTVGNLNGGYRRVKVNGRSFGVHRLVTMRYTGPAPSKFHIPHHKDSDRTNNDASNLVWATLSENTQASYKDGALARKRKRVDEIDEEGNVIASFESLTEATDKTKIPTYYILKVCHKKTKSFNHRFFAFAGSCTPHSGRI
jgi:hypothetical protein